MSLEKYLLARSRGVKSAEAEVVDSVEKVHDDEANVEMDKPSMMSDESLRLNDLPEVPLLTIFAYLTDLDRVRCESGKLISKLNFAVNLPKPIT